MPRPVTPPVSVDIVIELTDRPGRPIVLIERKFPPLGWALPGGFVNVGETVGAAACREAREETSLDVELRALLGCYSAPDRDPRGQTVALAFVARAEGNPVAADDAKALQIVEPAAVDLAGSPALVFDHSRVLHDYLVFRADGHRPLPD